MIFFRMFSGLRRELLVFYRITSHQQKCARLLQEKKSRK
ncbi:hypothetical protein UYSO10_2372 [Kosakonia radicincitans]|nr:hypothetical protein UYSO10_2372 [Kosakonia radicincitans]